MKSSAVMLARSAIHLFLLLLAACNLPANGPMTPAPFFPTPTFMPSPSPWPAISLPTQTLQPLQPLQPVNTPVPMVLPSQAPAPLPCNRAEFMGDQSIPDGTQVTAGATFTKVWRIRNAGSCSWTAGYGLLFDRGERMEAPLVQPLTSGTVPPGATMDLAVTLRAPALAGTYQADFRLRSADNVLFGIGPSGQGSFWVKVVVPPPPPTATHTPVPPNFDELVNYAGGGGGGSCGLVYPDMVPSFDIIQTSQYLEICIWGATFGPLASIEFISPDGRQVRPILVQVAEKTLQVNWSGYPSRGDFFSASDSDKFTIIRMTARIPANFPYGKWQISASGGYQARGSFSIGPEFNSPAVTAVNRERGDEFLPGRVLPGDHLLLPRSNGHVDVTGSGFPAGIPLYVLLYRQAFTDQYLLEKVQAVQTDGAGSFVVELDAPLTAGQKYMLLGVTDPHARIAGEDGTLDESLPRDFFILAAP
jgi:hypothetical protein